jgi:hypothetical protein
MSDPDPHYSRKKTHMHCHADMKIERGKQKLERKEERCERARLKIKREKGQEGRKG